MPKKGLSHGKWLGFWSWLFFEAIVISLVIYQGIDLFIGSKKLDFSIINGVLLAQGTIFTVVWGSKASSNFANKKEIR